ncbi:MAG: substrate-binding domain-containing protein, partial [Nostoc sp.]
MGFIFGGLWFFMERWAQINGTVTKPSETGNTSNPPNKCNVANLPEGTFNYGGSTTWAPIRKDVDSVLQSLCPRFILRYTQPPSGKPGSGTGIRMLIDNQLAFSQSSRSVKAEENAEAKQKEFSLKEIPVAIDGIAIAVNQSL